MARLLIAVLAFAAVFEGVTSLNADDADQLGANPIRRVVTMLQKMAKKVEAEGEKEEDLYNKFNCYCKTGSAQLTGDIAQSDAKIPQVQSDIEAAEAEEKQLRADLEAHGTDRTAAKAAIATATSQRETEHEAFVATSTEYKANLAALTSAIASISKGMSGGFLQAKSSVGTQLRKALSAATNLADYDRQLVTTFLDGGRAAATDSDGAGYIPASGEIVGILNQIKDDFEKSLADVESTEADAAKLFQELTNAKEKQVATLSEAIEKKTVRVGDLGVQIVSMKADLSDTEAALIENKKFLANLDESCEAKAAEWSERQKTRAEELVAIQETIKVLNDDDALELFKKALPSASLLQVRTSASRLRHRVLSLVQAAASRPHAGGARPGFDFLAMALSGRNVDFSKVVKMIDDMVAC